MMPVIEIEIDNTRGKIKNLLNIDQLSIISGECSFKVEGSEYKANAFKNRRRGGFEWDGYRKLFNTQYQTFPIGLLDRVRRLFESVGYTVNIINKRKINEPSVLYYAVDNIEYRGYQNDAVNRSLIHGNGVIKVGTGGGKTSIAARTIGSLGIRSVFIVHTRDLLYQTKETFERIFTNQKIGQIGDGIIDYQNITVATIQSLSILGNLKYEKYKYDEDADNDLIEQIELTKERIEQFRDYRKSIGCVMFDEVQRICSKTAYGVRFLFENANYAYGYSASPWRDDGSDLMIEASFGSRIVDISASELINKGYLVRPYITVKSIHSTWEGKTYEQIYKSAIVENVFRNMQVVQDAVEQYKLGRNTLVLVVQIKHGEILEKLLNGIGIPAKFISGKSHMSKRKQTIQDMRDGKAPIVIASTIADVGLDVPRLQSIVEAGAGKSSVTALQRVGRIMRPFGDKDKCYYITYADSAPYLNTQADTKINIWRTEPEFVVIKN